MADHTVIISRRADEMLLQHIRFLARVSVPAAKKLLISFEELLGALERNPFQFPLHEDINLPAGSYRKALFAKRYLAVFIVDGTQVYLDAVLDCRQDGHKISL